MQNIGEHLSETTKRRFETSTSPDGQRWAPNSPVTILQYLHVKSGKYDDEGKRTGDKKGYYLQDGRIGAKGIDAVMGKKPLIGESRSLMSTIHYRANADSVEVGSPMEYAAVQQFGAKAHQFGRSPWGDIQARPFIGLSNEDRRSIMDIISGYLSA
jgi:phage gpG-like protein